jgi:hypothetical protein
MFPLVTGMVRGPGKPGRVPQADIVTIPGTCNAMYGYDYRVTAPSTRLLDRTKPAFASRRTGAALNRPMTTRNAATKAAVLAGSERAHIATAKTITMTATVTLRPARILRKRAVEASSLIASLTALHMWPPPALVTTLSSSSACNWRHRLSGCSASGSELGPEDRCCPAPHGPRPSPCLPRN